MELPKPYATWVQVRKINGHPQQLTLERVNGTFQVVGHWRTHGLHHVCVLTPDHLRAYGYQLCTCDPIEGPDRECEAHPPVVHQ